MLLDTKLTSRHDLHDMLEHNNPGAIVLKFGANWCSPCKQIESYINAQWKRLPTDFVHFIKVDIDECIDIYAFLKAKRMISGIPTILVYYKGNVSIAPDDIISGTDTKKIKVFFDKIIENINNEAT
jgi:thiol:disulfide interchange protein